MHRYVDKALFLPLNVCPVYCRFCTRSYAIGPDTENVDKVALAKTPKQWQDAFQYISERPELEDIVISGGDVYQLPPKNVEFIGNALLDIPHVRRMRFATKGPAIMPMKIITHVEWLDAITSIVDRGRTMGKEVVLHTHFNAPEEITWITEKAMRMLFERGIFTRNQSVLIRGVNDTRERMQLLVKRLGYVNVHPYYVYMHDMVKGVEELRTTIATAVDTEKFVRGSTAGFNTPTFVCDAPGGGGKRDVHSYEYYDRENGIAVYAAPERQARQGVPLLRSDRPARAGRTGPLGRTRDSGRDDPRRHSQRGRRRRSVRSGVREDRPFRLDLVVALGALLISTVAALATVYQTRVIARQFSAAVWPYVSFDSTNSPNFTELDIRNDGLGPAIIRAVKLSWDGKPQPSIEAIVASLRASDPQMTQRDPRRVSIGSEHEADDQYAECGDGYSRELAAHRTENRGRRAGCAASPGAAAKAGAFDLLLLAHRKLLDAELQEP